MKKVFLLVNIIFFICLNNNASYSLQFEQIVNIDYIRYIVFDDSNNSDLVFLDDFHTKFNRSIKYHCDRYNLKYPENVHVYIYLKAWIFSQKTDQNGNKAAICDPNKLTIHFQNPTSRRMKKNLNEIINHEVIHYLAAHSRMNKSSEIHYIEEEALAAALYPCEIPLKKPIIETMKNYDDFKKNAEMLINSKNPNDNIAAYWLLYNWGKFIITNIGDKKLFSIIINEEIYNLEYLYIQYSKKK